MLKLKCIIIDDEPLAAMLIESYVKKTPYLELVATFSSAVEAMQSEELKDADLLFLDIQMPTLNGLEFSRMVNSRTRIVFTTAFNEYALEGYRVNALDYLVKPISYTDFLGSANRALEWFEISERANKTSVESPAQPAKADSIYVKSNYKLLRIELSKILYVESLKDYVKFVLAADEKPILSLMNIKRAEELLPEDDFLRVHRSFIVRKDKISIIERNRILFGSDVVPVGDAYKADFQLYLESHML
ncbi:MAG: LytTR family DNA-binding domain-containing protein [Rikenellaceae bacterium]